MADTKPAEPLIYSRQVAQDLLAYSVVLARKAEEYEDLARVLGEDKFQNVANALHAKVRELEQTANYLHSLKMKF